MNQIRNVTIIGAGTMGTGIAISIIASGLKCHLIDIDPAAVDRARGTIWRYFARQVNKERISEIDAAHALARLDGGTDLAAVEKADLVIEAVFEDLDLKLETFRKVNPYLRSGVIVATNTSALRVADLAAAFADHTLFLGMHYFSPAEINPVVEVVRGPETADWVVKKIDTFCAATGKKALDCRDQSGFAVNRFFCPYTNEAARLVDEGLGTPAQIDRVSHEALGVAAGPFFVMNLIKPRINLHAIGNLEPLGPFYAPAAAMVKVGEADGVWELEEDRQDAEAEKTITDRLRAGVFLPVLEELDEGVADPEAIDMGAALALRFGKPPCALMDALGPEEVRRLIEPLCDAHGMPLPKSLARVGSLLADQAA